MSEEQNDQAPNDQAPKNEMAGQPGFDEAGNKIIDHDLSQEAMTEIRAAVEGLDLDDDGHWTKEGLPDCNVLKERLGRKVTRSDVNTACGPDFTRQALQEYRAELARMDEDGAPPPAEPAPPEAGEDPAAADPGADEPEAADPGATDPEAADPEATKPAPKRPGGHFLGSYGPGGASRSGAN